MTSYGRLRIAVSLTVLSLTAMRADAQSVTVYRGICDASAAVALGKDHFAVADDELNILRIYKRGQPDAVGKKEIWEFLGTKSDKESDIEGAASVGSRTFWITSHGTNKEGKVQDRRRRFFAMDIVEGDTPTLKQFGKPYSKLIEDLTTDPRYTKYGLDKAATKAPKERDAFNIEGLAATADGKLLIGFRNPLPGKKALIVPLENPGELVSSGAKAKFGDPIEVKLDERGIRSIELIGSSYLIVAGPFDEETGFDLYRWTGDAKDDPEIVKDSKMAGLNPEALFSIPGTTHVQILSDDGAEKVAGGKKCKDLPQASQSFRSLTIQP